MKNWRICIIIPTYNNAKTVRNVVAETMQIGLDVLVVNDGSTDNTAQILTEINGIEKISYPKNRGKGHALQQGFKRALEKGYDFAITIDSDGQHEPKNIRDLVAVLQAEEKPIMLMGARNMDQAGVPKKSSFGNKFSSFWYWAETGIKLRDTQTGFRAYPVDAVNNIHFFTNRFEFEIEVIVRLAWRGIPVKEVPVLVHYPEDRVSHFRPFADFARISILNTFLFTGAVFYHTPKRVFFGKGEKNLKNRLKREFAKNSNEPKRMAASVGLGLFFGIFPIWGFQMLVAFFIASYFKLNRVVVLGFSNISLPPFIPLIIYASYLCGAIFFPENAIVPSFNHITADSIYLQFKQYLVGSVLLSFAAGIIGYLTALLILKTSQSLRK